MAADLSAKLRAAVSYLDHGPLTVADQEHLATIRAAADRLEEIERALGPGDAFERWWGGEDFRVEYAPAARAAWRAAELGMVAAQAEAEERIAASRELAKQAASAIRGVADALEREG